MTRGTGSLKTESRLSFRHEKKLSYIEETDDSCSALPQKEIRIAVESIENFDPDKIKEVIVRIDYAGNIIGQSFQVPISSKKVDIGLIGSIIIDDLSPQFLDEILSNPVLFTVLDCNPTSSAAISANVSPNAEKDSKKKTSKASASPISGSKLYTTNATVLGICNLDIGALAMGQTRIKETLLLESDQKVSPLEEIPWVKLPKLVVIASTGDEPLIPESEYKFNNVVGVTVESLYNVPDYVSEGSAFDAIIPVPSLGDAANNVKFPNGLTVTLKDSSCRKKWLGLLNIEGRGARSKYSILPNTCDVTSTLPEHFNLENEVNKSPRMVQWNTWKSSYMIKKDVNYFFSKIMKYRFWPIEIRASNRSKDLLSKDKSAKSDKKSKPPPSATVANPEHFTAFLNLSPLLYPGVTKARVAAQLYTYSQADLTNKCGMEFPVSFSQGSIANTRLRTSERSKASVGESEENKDGSGIPVFNERKSPTFIIVEVELQKPFTPKRNLEYIEKDLKARVSLKGAIKKKTTNFAIVHESFTRSIKDMVSVLTHEYQEFLLSLKKQNSNPSNLDTAFQKFLCKRENFFKMKTTLENKVVDLINEKYGAIEDYEEKLPKIYVYLVNEMHKITNNCLIGQEDVACTYFNTNNLQFYAEEALEEGDFESARNYLLSKLSRETSNPDYWLDCAVCCISLKRYEAAVEAVREALSLNFDHQMGLLVYALLMARFNDTVAEQTFQVLLAKHPNFLEGWVAFQLFYLLKNNSEGALIAHQMAKKLEFEKRRVMVAELEEQNNSEFSCKTYRHDPNLEAAREGKYGMASFRNGISWAEPLSWTITLCPPCNIKIETVVLLLKLGFYEYASLGLSQELLTRGTDEESLPSHYLYYNSVNFYLQGRYEEAISLLQSFVKKYGKDCFIWSLLGHCYYKLENNEKAIACYEYVIESFNRPDDIHLIFLRMGFYYIDAKKFPCAKQIFMTGCKYSPTPRLWKGMGIACLRLGDLEEADISFSEANYLDNRDPEIWAYLALTNAMLRRMDLFKHCFSEAKKRNLENMKLEEEIRLHANLYDLDHEEF